MRSFCQLVLLAALAAACGGKPITRPLTLYGGKVIPASTLEEGRRAYVVYCRACHGLKGDGQGPASVGLRPPPRDFRQGIFKFAAVSAGSLPNDADLVRIVTRGLHGTAMLPWQVPPQELNAIIQYIKTFSPRWQAEPPGDPVVESADPFGGSGHRPSPGVKAQAVELGKKVYHGLAQCSQCHAAYATRQYIHDAALALTHNPACQFRNDLYYPQLSSTDYLSLIHI